jgi:hypothetical protein
VLIVANIARPHTGAVCNCYRCEDCEGFTWLDFADLPPYRGWPETKPTAAGKPGQIRPR